MRGVQNITPEEVKKNMEIRISELGMFTARCRLSDVDTYVAFGASEIMMSGLRNDYIETTVTACDGAGTVIASNPALVQGIGGRMSGRIETEPIEEVIEGIQKLQKKLRELESELGIDLIIIAVHVTGVSKEEAQDLLKNSDIVISCASKYIRELAKPLVQVAAAIPLFALTQKGKELIIERAKDSKVPF